MRLARAVAVVGGVFVFMGIAAGQQAQPPQHLVQDWSSRHVVFTGLTQESAAALAQRDPRAWHSWAAHAGKRSSGPAPQARTSLPAAAVLHRHAHKSLAVDWNEPISGAVDPRFSPAKFSFDINAAPDCTNDYVVFPTTNSAAPGQSGGGTSPSLVAFNNLYTGPGPTGICPIPLAPSDQPTVLFGYNTATFTNGTANLSPALSLDGKKIAFVETDNVSGRSAFHVLTWKAGEGTAPDAAAVPGDCSPGNSCMTTLVLSNTQPDHDSSPFIDYANDVAYVMDDGGTLHQIASVFGGTPTEVTTGGWPISLTAFGGRFGSPVLDSVSGHILVTDDSAGAIWVVDLATARLITTRSGYSIAADPIVDSTNQIVLIVGCSSAGDLVVDQYDTSGNFLQRLDVGTLGFSTMVYSGTFDNNYFNDPATGSFYFAGSFPSGASLFQVGFSVGFLGLRMNTGATGPLVITNGSTSTPGPLTEVFNPNLGATPDRLFVGMDANCANGSFDGCIESLDISSGLPAGILDAYTVTGSSLFSESGIIVDNVSTQAQAANIYFEATPLPTPLNPSTRNSAIKLTQSSLQ